MSGLWRLVCAVLFFASIAFGQQPVRTADAACERCHSAIYKKYLATPMANASGRATDRLIPGDFTHAASGVHYRIYQDLQGRDQHGAASLSFADTKDSRVAGTRALAYFLGSGHLGVTYLYTQEGYLLESPVAWYATTKSYDMKPGFGTVTEMPAALPMEAGCLRCHMSGVAAPEAGSSSKYAGLPFQQTGITCESCHGDTTAHVRTGGKAATVNPAKLDADRRDSVCISCHLEGDVTVKRAGHSALNYRPGDRISDYLSYFVLAGRDPLIRGVSEVEQLAASHCKRASGDRMSCTSCHDPHGSPSALERVDFYRAKCLACHRAASFATTHHPENPDCTSCHMPRSAAQNIPHVAWTDHRILRNPQAAGTSLGDPKNTDLKTTDAKTTLTAIFSPQATSRDAAMAMYTAVMTGLSADRSGALAKLKQAYTDGERDVPLLEALGIMSAVNGDGAAAEAHFREILQRDPTDLTALSDLGIYLARRGDLEAAAAMWKQAFTRNQDEMGLARNLANAQCALSDETAAKRTMADALQFSPGFRKGWDFACPSAQQRPVLSH